MTVPVQGAAHVPDHRRDQFSSWKGINAHGPLTIAVPDLPYYIEKLRERAFDRWRAERGQKELLLADEASTQLSYRAMLAREQEAST